MKLTNHLRNVILEKIMAGLPPEIDYMEQAQQVIWADSICQLPTELQSAVNSNSEVKNYLEVKSYIRIPGCSCLDLRSFGHYYPTEETIKQIQELHSKHAEQRDSRRSIEQKLRTILDSVNTVKQFTEGFPEFAQYVPKPEEPIRNLPSASILNELNAMGWKQS